MSVSILSLLRTAAARCFTLAPLLVLALVTSALRAQAPANDHFADALPLAPGSQSGTWSGTSTTVGATAEPGEPSHDTDYTARSSIWFSWVAPSDGAVVVDTLRSVGALAHAIYTGATLGSLVEIAVDFSSSNPLFEKRPVPVVAGTTYRIVVGNRFDQGDRGTVRLNLVFASAPTITEQPGNMIAAPGQTVTTRVVASGADLTYQWHRQGIPIPGATAATFTLANVQPADGGAYHAVVTNSAGPVASATVLLRGTAPPPVIVAAPADRVATAGTPVTLSVAATAAAGGPLAYQWRRNGFPLPGATAADLVFARVSRSDADSYDVRVNDGLSAAYSARIRLDVSPAATPRSFGLDPTFQAALETAAGSVARLRRTPDGRLLAAGTFGRYAGSELSHLVRLRADATVDPTFVGTAFDAGVSDVAVQPDGKLLVAGLFARVAGVPRPILARLLADGTYDPTFAPGPTFTVRRVAHLHLQSDGKILLAGDFTATAGTSTRRHLVRLHPDGSLDPTFAPEPDAPILALAVLPGDRLVVGGTFTALAGAPRRSLARLNSDGSLDPAFPAGTGPAGSVQVLLPLPDGHLIVSGAFGQFNGTTARGLVRLRPDGTRDPAFVGLNASGSFSSGGNTADGSIRDLALHADGRILAVGSFQFIDGGFLTGGSYGVSMLRADGTRDPAFAPEAAVAGGAATALVADDGRLLVGGDFGRFTFAPPRGGVVAFTSAGRLDPAVVGTLSTTIPSALAAVPGGKFLVAGNFTHVNGAPRPHLARLLSDGSLDPTFNPAPDDTVTSLAVQGDGRIVISGNFRPIGPTARSFVARLLPDGALDPSFVLADDPARRTPGFVAVSALAEGRVLLASADVSSLFSNRRYFARLLADGSLDRSFVPFSGSTALSFSFSGYAVRPDEGVLCANLGNQSSGDTGKPPVLLRLTPSGAIDPSFDPGIVPILGSGLHALSQLPDGSLLVGGTFTTYAGAARNRLARLRADGSLDPTFVPALSATTIINRVLPAADGHLYLFRTAVAFNNPDLPLVSALTRLAPDQRLDADFGLAFNASRTTFPAVLLLDDGNLLLAGDTFSDATVTRRSLVRTRALSGAYLIASPASRTLAAGANLSLAVTVGGAADATYQWFKDGELVPGAVGATYLLAAAQPSASGSYVVRISHAGGSLDSPAAVVVVTPSPPFFASSVPTPAGPSPTVQTGTRYALAAPSLSAGSTPLAYQWHRDGTPLPGETGAALFRTSWSAADTGNYTVTITNSLGTVTSLPFRQTVADDPAWEWVAPRPQGNPLSLVTYLEGAFYACGTNGTLLRSTDGREWTLRRLGTSSGLGPVAFGAGRFVVLAAFGGLFSSEDGLAWIPRESGLADGRSLSRLAYGTGRFVAVGQRGAVSTSADGRTWSTATLPVADPSAAVAFGAGRWVVVTSLGRVLTSPDGLAWTEQRPLPESAQHLAFGAGLFVTATLDSSAVYTSPDGLAWTRRFTGASSTAAITDLHYAQGGFLAAIASSTARYLASPDGLAWREITPRTPLDTTFHTVTRGGDLYVQAASAPNLLRWSHDGLDWHSVSPSEPRSYRAIATDGTVAVAVGTNQTSFGNQLAALLRTSFDGVTWVDRTNVLGLSLADVASAAPPARGFVAVGTGASLLTSADGLVWTPRPLGLNATLRGVHHLDGRWFAVGENTLFVSPDAVAWERIPLPGAPSLYRLAHGAGTFVAVGAAGTILTSRDARTWTARSAGTTGTLLDVIFAAGRFLALGFDGTLVSSPDGMVWTRRTDLLLNLTRLAPADGRLFALGSGNGTLESADGLAWRPALHGTGQALTGLVEFRRRLIAVGSFGTIISRDLPAPAGTTLPVVSASPVSRTVRTGGRVELAVAAGGTPPPTYQWIKDNLPVPGATSATLVLDATFAAAGTYTCLISTPAGAVTTAPAVLIVAPAAQLANLSIRNRLDADQILTVGLTVGGNGASKRALVRAAGPALAALGVSAPMADPRLTVWRSGTRTAENDNWSSTVAPAFYAAGAADFARAGAFPFPVGSRDAAVQVPLVDSTTVQVSGPGAGTVLVECYDLSPTEASPNRLVNLSARARVGTGADLLVAGFYVAGDSPLRVLVRGVGPALASFGVAAPLADPQLALFDSNGTRLASNDDWPAALAGEFARVGAFPLPAAGRDAALVATLSAGRTYTVQIAGAAGGTGEALLEVYELP
jgi:uncharacterized delta-60 repeat protein